MTSKRRKLSTGQKLILLGLVDIAFTIFTFIPRKAKARRKPTMLPDVRAFRTAHGEGAISPYLAEAERVSQVTDLAAFGKTVALSRSGYDNKAVDRSAGADACGLYLKLKDAVFPDSPYAEREWCWGAGGWYLWAPAEVMGLGPFPTLDPKLVFDPAASTAMLAGMVNLIIEDHLPNLPPEHRTWLAVRRGLENVDAIYDYNEARSPETGSREIREAFESELEAAGIAPQFAGQKVSSGTFPGTQPVWDALRALPTA